MAIQADQVLAAERRRRCSSTVERVRRGLGRAPSVKLRGASDGDEDPKRRPPVANQHPGEVGPENRRRIVEAATGTNRIDRRRRRGEGPQPVAESANAPAGLVRGDHGAVPHLPAQRRVGRRGLTSGAVQHAGEPPPGVTVNGDDTANNDRPRCRSVARGGAPPGGLPGIALPRGPPPRRRHSPDRPQARPLGGSGRLRRVAGDTPAGRTPRPGADPIFLAAGVSRSSRLACACRIRPYRSSSCTGDSASSSASSIVDT